MIFQCVSLFVGVANVPLLLHYLSSDEFVAWIVIATLGALTIQLEQGLLVIATRRVAWQWHGEDVEATQRELARVRSTFHRFSASVLVCLGGVGLFYFSLWANMALPPHWELAWALFVSAYAINYWFGHNNVVLLAMEATHTFNMVNSCTRLLNLALGFLFLSLGLSILGLALSFFLSVVVSVLMHARNARRQLAVARGKHDTSDRPAHSHRPEWQGLGFSLYTLSNFLVYRGAFLLLPLLPHNFQLDSYGLALQLVAIVYAVSVIPAQVWLGQLVTAVSSRSLHRVASHLGKSLAFAAGVFLLLFGLALGVAGPALSLLGSDVSLPPAADLALVFSAFFIESLIFLLVNVLLLLGRQRYLYGYSAGVLFIVSLCCAYALFLDPDVGVRVFLILPMLFQGLVALPGAVVVLTFALARLGTRGS